jgi:tetratricopeptide (TPR) repeat protein
LDLEARLAKLLSDSDRVIKALAKSFELNPKNSYVALRLAGCHERRGAPNQAVTVLRKAIDANSNKKQLHYAYAKILLNTPGASADELEYELRRAYSPGDKNYDTQVLHARQLYVNGRLDDSRAIFDSLSSARVPFRLKREARYPLTETYHGEVWRVEAAYCFVRRDGLSDMIYCSQDNEHADTWRRLIPGRRVTFNIAFNMRGPVAINVVVDD